MQPAEEGHDNRREPIAHVEIDADLPRRPRHLEHPCHPRKRPGGAQTEQDQPCRVHTREPRRPRRLARQANVIAQDVPVQQHIGQDHRQKRRHHAPMHARPGNHLGIMGGLVLLQVPRARKPVPLGIAQQPQRHLRQQLLGHIDQHQRHEDLVRAEPNLQDGRDHRPGPAANRAPDDHQRKDEPRFHRVKGQPHPGAAQRADDILPLGPDIPDPRPEPEAQPDGNQNKRRPLHQQLRPVIKSELPEQRLPEDRPDRLDRVLAQSRKQRAPRDHGDHHGHDRRQVRPELRRLRSFLKLQHDAPPPPLPWEPAASSRPCIFWPEISPPEA